MGGNCYGLSVISIMVTTEKYLRSNGVYKTSKTIRLGVAEPHNNETSKIYRICRICGICYILYILYIPYVSVITMGRSYIFKYIVPTIR